MPRWCPGTAVQVECEKNEVNIQTVFHARNTCRSLGCASAQRGPPRDVRLHCIVFVHGNERSIHSCRHGINYKQLRCEEPWKLRRRVNDYYKHLNDYYKPAYALRHSKAYTNLRVHTHVLVWSRKQTNTPKLSLTKHRDRPAHGPACPRSCPSA
jgi:hypothetical protein